MFCEKRCSLKFRKFHRKTLVPESLSNKVAGQKPTTLSKKRLLHRCFSRIFFPRIFLKRETKICKTKRFKTH